MEPEWVVELQEIVDSFAISDHEGMMSATERFLALARELGDDAPVVFSYLTPDQLERAKALAQAAEAALGDKVRELNAEMKRRGR